MIQISKTIYFQDVKKTTNFLNFIPGYIIIPLKFCAIMYIMIHVIGKAVYIAFPVSFVSMMHENVLLFSAKSYHDRRPKLQKKNLSNIKLRPKLQKKKQNLSKIKLRPKLQNKQNLSTIKLRQQANLCHVKSQGGTALVEHHGKQLVNNSGGDFHCPAY